MLYKNQPVTVMRNANLDDEGYDVGKEQILIQFTDETRAVVTRGELTPEPVLVPVVEEVPVIAPKPKTEFSYEAVKNKKKAAHSRAA